MKCPGQDMRYWKPGDIFNAKCPKCGGTVEFFKDEVRRKCRCGHGVTNPKLDFGCAEWCPYAEQCIGAIPEEVKARQKAEQENSLRDRVAFEMKRYFGKDLKRIDHALKVARFSERILKGEGGNPLVILCAAYLHDIGIREAKKERQETGTDCSLQQETEGVPIAWKILERLNLKKEDSEEICDIIGHHHHPREEGTLNFQVLFEADWLVNMEEKGLSQEEVQAIIKKSFKTEAGRKLAEELFLS
jgi:HD superfamily phosphohydrolase YqeK